MSRIFCLIVFSILTLFIHGQSIIIPPDSTRNMDGNRLKNHVNILASDHFEGRGTGQIGQKRAAKYIRNHFRKIGLRSITKDTADYVQSFHIGNKDRVVENVSIYYKRNRKLSKKDFYTEGYFIIPELNAETVWVGYGIDDERYSDYESVDVKGKVVVVMLGEPQSTDSTYLITNSSEHSVWNMAYYKVATAKAKGASGIILVHDSEHDFIRYRNRAKILSKVNRNDALQRGIAPPSFGTFFIRPKALYKILGFSKKKQPPILQQFELNPLKVAKRFNHQIKIKAVRRITRTATENIIGLLPGTDLATEVIVIAAHYDHLGIRENIYNGADDNASGTSVLLELAEVLATAKANGWKNKRSILFIGFSGEEKGLLGSLHYTKNPIVSMKDTKAMINMDMIGRAKLNKKEQWITYILGAETLTKQNSTLQKEHAPNIKLNYTYNSKTHSEQLYYRSDHYNFAKYGVPFIYFTTGFHKDYHQPTDDSHKINYTGLRDIGQMVLHLVGDLVNTAP